MTNSRLTTLLICLLSIICITSCRSGKGEFDALYENLPFEMEMVSRPAIPALEANILDFGGNGNGVVLNTQAFEDAINWLSERGGGHLIVPEGIWKTGPIELKSNIDLHIKHEGIIVFDPSATCIPSSAPHSRGLTPGAANPPSTPTGRTTSPSPEAAPSTAAATTGAP